jgi:CRISPR type IV-associated protein Csf3
MQPLRIDFGFATPVANPAHLIHFDALLAAIQVERALARGDVDPFAAQEVLPLDHVVHDEHPIWCASALRFEVIGTSMEYFTQRTDTYQMALDKGEVYQKGPNVLKTDSGQLKQSLVWVPLIHAPAARAYCIGDRDAVEELCRDITHVGGLRRMGRGQVRSVSVTPDDATRHEWQWRALPWHQDDGGERAPVYAAIRPPYWKPENKCMAWVPIG